MAEYTIDQLYAAIQSFRAYVQANMPYKTTVFSGQVAPNTGTGQAGVVGSLYIQVEPSGALTQVWIKSAPTSNTAWTQLTGGSSGGSGVELWQAAHVYNSFSQGGIPTIVYDPTTQALYYNKTDFTSGATFQDDLDNGLWFSLAAAGGGIEELDITPQEIVNVLPANFNTPYTLQNNPGYSFNPQFTVATETSTGPYEFESTASGIFYNDLNTQSFQVTSLVLDGSTPVTDFTALSWAVGLSNADWNGQGIPANAVFWNIQYNPSTELASVALAAQIGLTGPYTFAPINNISVPLSDVQNIKVAFNPNTKQLSVLCGTTPIFSTVVPVPNIFISPIVFSTLTFGSSVSREVSFTFNADTSNIPAGSVPIVLRQSETIYKQPLPENVDKIYRIIGAEDYTTFGDQALKNDDIITVTPELSVTVMSPRGTTSPETKITFPRLRAPGLDDYENPVGTSIQNQNLYTLVNVTKRTDTSYAITGTSITSDDAYLEVVSDLATLSVFEFRVKPEPVAVPPLPTENKDYILLGAYSDTGTFLCVYVDADGNETPITISNLPYLGADLATNSVYVLGVRVQKNLAGEIIVSLYQNDGTSVGTTISESDPIAVGPTWATNKLYHVVGVTSNVDDTPVNFAVNYGGLSFLRNPTHLPTTTEVLLPYNGPLILQAEPWNPETGVYPAGLPGYLYRVECLNLTTLFVDSDYTLHGVKYSTNEYVYLDEYKSINKFAGALSAAGSAGFGLISIEEATANFNIPVITAEMEGFAFYISNPLGICAYDENVPLSSTVTPFVFNDGDVMLVKNGYWSKFVVGQTEVIPGRKYGELKLDNPAYGFDYFGASTSYDNTKFYPSTTSYLMPFSGATEFSVASLEKAFQTSFELEYKGFTDSTGGLFIGYMNEAALLSFVDYYEANETTWPDITTINSLNMRGSSFACMFSPDFNAFVLIVNESNVNATADVTRFTDAFTPPLEANARLVLSCSKDTASTINADILAVTDYTLTEPVKAKFYQVSPLLANFSDFKEVYPTVYHLRPTEDQNYSINFGATPFKYQHAEAKKIYSDLPNPHVYAGTYTPDTALFEYSVKHFVGDEQQPWGNDYHRGTLLVVDNSYTPLSIGGPLVVPAKSLILTEKIGNNVETIDVVAEHVEINATREWATVKYVELWQASIASGELTIVDKSKSLPIISKVGQNGVDPATLDKTFFVDGVLHSPNTSGSCEIEIIGYNNGVAPFEILPDNPIAIFLIDETNSTNTPDYIFNIPAGTKLGDIFTIAYYSSSSSIELLKNGLSLDLTSANSTTKYLGFKLLPEVGKTLGVRVNTGATNFRYLDFSGLNYGELASNFNTRGIENPDAPKAYSVNKVRAANASDFSSISLTPVYSVASIVMDTNFSTTLLNIEALPAGKVTIIQLSFTQDNVGNRTITWQPKFKFSQGQTGTLSTAPGATDLFTCESFDGGVTFFVSPVKGF